MTSTLTPSSGATTAGDGRLATIARRGALAAFAGTAAWLVLGIESCVRGGEMHYRDAFWAIPWALTTVAFAALHAVQWGRLPRWGRAAGVVTIGTMLLLLAGMLGLVAGIDSLAFLGFPIGAIAWFASMIPFGIATAVGGAVPRRVGVALALLEPGSILTGLALSPLAGLHERGNYSGGLEKGLVLLMVAFALDAVASRLRPS